MGLNAAVVGASGYAGGEVLRLLCGHPGFDLGPLAAASNAGRRITELHPHLTGLPALAARSFDDVDLDRLAAADVVFLALPHGESAALAARLPEQSLVIDLGADFRLADPAAWSAHYGGEHAGTWTYGLPELPGAREAIRSSRRIANTGCHAVATILGLAPLLASGLADPDDVVVVSASGTSGAGRAPKPQLTSAEVMGAMSPYRVGAHQHVPEIKQATGARSLSFTPLLAPMPRGILATITARPNAVVTAGQVRDVLAAAYDGETFVHVLAEGSWPHTGATLGANTCLLQATVDADSGRVIVVSALDNLVKGAAGQAIQCANLALGLPEDAGLSVTGIAP